MNTHSILKSRIDDAHLRTLTEGVSIGYAALAEIMSGTPVLDSFWPGRSLRGYLADPCIQYGIEQVARRLKTFHTELRPNKAGNHIHTRFHAPGVCITTHYTGADAGRRAARKAINRAELALRCGDLFDGSGEVVVDSDSTIYTHLLHGGHSSPLAVTLAIPDQAQTSYPLTPWALELVPAEKADVEQVAEAMSFKLAALVPQSEESREAG